MGRRRWITALALGCAVLAAGVAGFQSSRWTRAAASDSPPAHAVMVASGYAIRPMTGDLTDPVGAAVGSRGALYVAESGADTGTPPRVLKLKPGQRGGRTTLADDFPAPLTGITWHEGKLYVAYAGGVDVLDPETGVHHPVLTKLSGLGDHPNGPVVFGADGRLYFAVGSATNAGVVGQDNVDRGWVKRTPEVHDIPCRDVTLRGTNFTIPNPLTPEDEHDLITTGAFRPFGKTTARLQTIAGEVPCTGAVLRTTPDGTGMELVAWGLRYPAGLAFGPDGGLYATMQGFEDRGSRPITGDRDYLYRIEQGRWYGWPDFAGGRSVTEEEFQKPSMPAPVLLADAPEQPPLPVATFPHGSGAAGLIFPPEAFGLRGEALVTLSRSGSPSGDTRGTEAPDRSEPPGGRVVRVNPRTGRVTTFARNATGDQVAAPDGAGASGDQQRPEPLRLARPVALAAGPRGEVYVVDAGQTRPGEGGLPRPIPGTGRLWKLTRTGLPHQGAGLGAIQWQWALVGLTLTVAGARLVVRE